MTVPPPPPGTHTYQASPTEQYFDPNSTSPYAQGTVQQISGLTPQSPHVMSPVSAGGTVVVSAMTPHPVMAVHAAPPGVNGVTVMNGGILSPGLASSKSNNNSGVPAHHGLHSHTQPLLQSPPPGHAHLQSHSHVGGGGGSLIPAVGGAHHQTHHHQYIYASSAMSMGSATGSGGSPHFVYKFHHMHPSVGVGQGGHAHSTY